MKSATKIVLPIALSFGLAACVGPLARQERAPEPAPQRLPAAPAGQVTQSALPPPAATAPTDPSAMPAAGTQVAALGPQPATAAATAPAAAPAKAQVEIGRTDLLGGWTVNSGGSTCQLFMSLTTWSGGYRATTRGCSSPELQGVSAWNLEGQQVKLVNESGATAVRLYASSKTQFSGQTGGGTAVSVSR